MSLTTGNVPARALLAEHERKSALSMPKTENWIRAEHVIAFIGVVLIALRLKVTSQLLTVGDLYAVAAIPLVLALLL